MIGMLWDVVAMLRILANEVENEEAAGGELWPLPGARPGDPSTPLRSAQDDRKEAEA